MRLWKQLVLSLIVLCAGLYVWVTFVPGAGALLEKMGLSQEVVAAIAPKSEGAPATGQGRGRGGFRNGPTVVVTAPAGEGVVNDQLTAIGNGEAIESVVIAPQASGNIATVNIRSGDRVKKGEVIASLDREEQVIARDQAQVALESAEEKLSIYKNAKSTVSRVSLVETEIAAKSAKLALDNAELTLKRRDIVSPIDGIAGIIPVSVGDYVTTSTAIVTVDNRSELLVDFWAPERFAAGMATGQPVQATAVARPGEVFSGEIEAVDNRIDEASRTFKVRARIPNADDKLRAGMAFTVSMKFGGDSYPSVDPLAVQWDSDGSYVWRVTEGKVEKVRVAIIQRNPDVVLVKADIAKGDGIVTAGLQRLREGAEVQVAGAPEAEKPKAEDGKTVPEAEVKAPTAERGA
ncbi:efflux RND transporter periplasmic adaptor subunit [Rhizobium sp. NRK18]|uniref:efflux RND transporter periplasmic adaptor subunit n=1 Tax=Rhizobium sp. NRK18 TaxID=2964667 RepID=UPI0021C33B5E|nr:efflux RND transporter periplasmic adaptor subunit [Rhizobium sp. NRK18]MCQ2003788.1 efflux RND transporter periplasmic adaptor subunit [Rhizobium sp. NRK18]